MRQLLFAFFALLLTPAKAQESQHAFSFLRIPVSAHGAALGGDNISIIEDDASLAISNPALLASVSHRTVSLGYMNYMSGVGMYSAGYTHVFNDRLSAGLAAQYVNYGSMKQMDEQGNDCGDFTPADIVIEPMLSYTLAKNVVGGMGAKFIYSKIAGYTSTAAAIDLGINYYQPDVDFSASLAVRNLGGQLSTYDEEYEALPIDLLVGASWGLQEYNLPFRVSLTFSDLGHLDYAFLRHASFGVDVLLSPQFYIAGGLNLRRMHDMEVATTDGTTTGGAGLSVGAGLTLDRFTLGVSYGKYHVSSSSLMVNAAFTL